MKSSIPRTLPHHGHTINYTGPGRSPGSLTYFDATTREVLELYFAQIERLGPIYSLGRVANNPVIGTVRIDHSVLNGAGPAVLGAVMIVGGFQYLPEGPRATAVWRAPVAVVAPKPTAAPAVVRQYGMVTWVHQLGAYGSITNERTGQTVFVHRTQLRRGAMLMQGCRMTYLEGVNHRGPTAFDVWPT